ncbi:uncharacterized protein N7518_000166 [Penicillium psychrosexuale]|uniref:uncharacterized protein n=1 Tax=Penicillium psychrosexuale TaxID=1002107 RepID=UPI0025454196|nr:uncharacterized protein N7518_000166 [Penicillium psychrosexuale]KAJ5803863.1 hypothetical protein N7518_000166 [Penicillium psychrosexuale]
MAEPTAPTAVYSTHKEKVLLRIATGGAGQSGLLEALAKSFVQYCVDHKKAEPFLIEWYKTDTTLMIENLLKEVVDIAITSHALNDKVIDRVVLFTKLFNRMEESKNSAKPIKFLSRYDRSDGNIVESLLWATIGQVPWADPPTSWYHMFPGLSFQAIREAACKGEYTVTDKETWLAIEDETRKQLTIFAEGNDDENDLLLNHAHILVGKNAKNKATANDFADWMVRDDGGQQVIRSFTKSGEVLYSTIPAGVDPLDRVKGLLGFSGSTKAAFPVEWAEGEIYFFNDNQYARIDPNKEHDDQRGSDILSMWPGLKKFGFSPINSIFTATDNEKEAYFFCGSRCLRMHGGTGVPNGNPFRFQEKWPALKDVGFDLVDASLPFSFKGSEYQHVVCFFRKERYALIDVIRNILLESGNIALRFNALAAAKFKTVDAVVFQPRTNKHEAWFFSGKQYVLVHLIGDSIARGPLDVAAQWKSLKAAGFY